ncbi:hypothetical protein Lser_V15G11690 [Lactuca serriola]
MKTCNSLKTRVDRFETKPLKKVFPPSEKNCLLSSASR